MRIAYDILLSLKITHDFFPGKVFEDFELIPDKKTMMLMDRFRLVGKKNSNLWNLFFQEEGPFATNIKNLENEEFLFTLKIHNSFFYSITDRTYLNGKNEMLYFSFPIDSEIFPEKRGLRPLKFNYSIHKDVPVKLKLTTARGGLIFEEEITDELKRSKEINLEQEGENAYNLSEDSIPPGNAILDNFFSKNISPGDFFYGTVYFKIIPVDNRATANQYQIIIPSAPLVKEPAIISDDEVEINPS